MRRAVAWLLAGCLVLGLIALWAFVRARGKKADADRILADVIEAWQRPSLDRARERATDLARQFGHENAVVRDAQKDVDKLKKELEDKYRDLELTPEEIEARFRNLRV